MPQQIREGKRKPSDLLGIHNYADDLLFVRDLFLLFQPIHNFMGIAENGFHSDRSLASSFRSLGIVGQLSVGVSSGYFNMKRRGVEPSVQQALDAMDLLLSGDAQGLGLTGHLLGLLFAFLNGDAAALLAGKKKSCSFWAAPILSCCFRLPMENFKAGRINKLNMLSQLGKFNRLRLFCLPLGRQGRMGWHLKTLKLGDST